MNDRLLWYTARGTGAMALLLLSAVMCLGLLARTRVALSPRWPRFLTAALHHDLALLSLLFLVVHIVTAVADPFTHLGLTAAVVPFGSSYRTFWLGLGTLAVELMLAVVLTSLVRQLLGHRLWRSVHWLAYAVWPMAVAHTMGTGTDAFSLWMLAITAVSVLAVVTALGLRWLSPVPPLQEQKRWGRSQAQLQTPSRF